MAEDQPTAPLTPEALLLRLKELMEWHGEQLRSSELLYRSCVGLVNRFAIVKENLAEAEAEALKADARIKELEAKLAAGQGPDPTPGLDPTPKPVPDPVPTPGSSIPATAVRIPLRVPEVAGVSRKGEVLTSGIPLPPGMCSDVAELAVLDPAGKLVPAQFDVFQTWHRTGAEGSIRTVLVSFPADVEAGATAEYTLLAKVPGLHYGSPAPNQLAYSFLKGQFHIATGAADFVISPTTLLEGGRGKTWGEGMGLASGTMSARRANMGRGENSTHGFMKIRRFEMESEGPLRVVLIVETESDLIYGERPVSERRRYIFTAGSPTFVVEKSWTWEGSIFGLTGSMPFSKTRRQIMVERLRNLPAFRLLPELEKGTFRAPDPEEEFKKFLADSRFAGAAKETESSVLAEFPMEETVLNALLLDRVADTLFLNLPASLGGVDAFVLGAVDKPTVSGKLIPGNLSSQLAMLTQNLRANRATPPVFGVIAGEVLNKGTEATGGAILVRVPAGAVAIALDHMHRYEPQALSAVAAANQVHLNLAYANEKHWLAHHQGAIVRAAVSLLPSNGEDSKALLSSAVWAPLNHPLRALPTAEWWNRAGAENPIPVRGAGALTIRWGETVERSLKRTLQLVDEEGLAGLMTYGTHPRYWGEGGHTEAGEREGKWDTAYRHGAWTDYHQASAAASIFAIYSGSSWYLDEIAAPAARRMAYTQVMQVTPGDPWFYGGMSVTGYGGHRDDFNSSHQYFEPMFLYALLTGDWTVGEKIKGGAQRMVEFLGGRTGHVLGRQPNQWFTALRFLGGLYPDEAWHQEFLQFGQKMIRNHYLETAVAGRVYGFLVGVDGEKPIPAGHSTVECPTLYSQGFYDLETLAWLSQETGDAVVEITRPDGVVVASKRPSGVVAEVAKGWEVAITLAGGDGSIGGRWARAFRIQTEGRWGGSSKVTNAYAGSGDDLLYPMDKPGLAAAIARAALARPQDAALRARAVELANFALDQQAKNPLPMGKLFGLGTHRVHTAVALLGSEK